MILNYQKTASAQPKANYRRTNQATNIDKNPISMYFITTFICIDAVAKAWFVTTAIAVCTLIVMK